MNEHVRTPTAAMPLGREPAPRPTTRAADGVPRLRWTLAEFERMGELGLLREGEHVELVEGELVPMPAKGIRHENVRTALLNWFARRLPESAIIMSEPGWRPGGDNYREPDIMIAPADTFPTTVSPDQVLLIVEVAMSSLAFDTGLKATLYASLGVRDYWVVDAQTLRVRVFREPRASGFARVTTARKTGRVTPLLVPELAVRMGDLRVE